MEPLGVAIIGAGGISVAHAESFGQYGDQVKVMAFTDSDIAKARARAAEFQAPLVGSDYEPLLQRDDIHIISICSPPFHHFQVIMDSLQAGKHVLCEKPVVLSLAQLDAVENLVRQSGKCFGGAFQWRFGTSVQQVKDLYEQGFFGKLIYATSNLFWHRTQEYFDVDWRNTWEKSGGGIIFTLACHGLDALIYMLGDIAAVTSAMAALKYPIEIEDTGSVILRFQNGALGAINATVNAHQQRSRIEVIGTELEAISGDDPYCLAYLPWEFRSVMTESQQRALKFLADRPYAFVPASHRRLVKDFVTAVRAGRQPAVDTTEIRRSLQVLTAIYKSNRLGKQVELPISRDDAFYFGLNPRN
ncbi:MAG: Gfo/Idh/MocA family oxidoreductase [candidate division KSB1 bacterium]|nr:Gfo/Idh/MocA family oxidoreductase [candidate division KSB1 bacterium]MDZ7340016.1 Gfo/Idh/MocA family oxidoreductase [candidate division KSB1 bacterium]